MVLICLDGPCDSAPLTLPCWLEVSDWPFLKRSMDVGITFLEVGR